MIFIDGIGIGKADKINNPFFRYNFKTFSSVFGTIPHLGKQYLESNNSFVFPVDPLLGVEGIPQSGTGQTSIFCGINAPKLIGKHFGPYPYSTLVTEIEEKNLFKEFLKKKKNVAFANAYPQVFFDYVNSGRKRLSVTTLSCLLSGVRLNRIVDLHRGKALSAEIDNERLTNRLGYKLPIIQPQTAAKRLLRIAEENHFTLFEIFHTDHLGHGRNIEMLEYFSRVLDEFLFTIITRLPKSVNLLVCSDHGNYEDLSIKMHTMNPAVGISSGKNAKFFSEKIKSLVDIKKTIMELY
ncbi:MAG: metalloenzyme domain protein [Ignavibacteria bacterium]|nr:MAG: metalloenzyme domain protein [Ignavibacteria bacterium]KAF0159712.1 MAG: metalloenzyme domain protein [Ignavibacteria bacterium]